MCLQLNAHNILTIVEYQEIIPARNPKQCEGSKKIMYNNVDDDINADNGVDDEGDVDGDGDGDEW